MRLYKKHYNLRQICNIAVYMLHSACTIHLLNLPEKTARRDITHGIKHLEEIAEDWLCGRRTLGIISVLARKWNCDLPEEATHVLQRTDERWGTFNMSEVPSPRSHMTTSPSPPAAGPQSPAAAKREPCGHHHPMARYVASTTRALAGPAMVPELNKMASVAPGFPNVAAMPHVNGNGVTANPVPLAVDELGIPAWRQPMASYGQSYGPPSSNPGTSSQPSRSTTRNATPSSSVYAVDGQDWYLKDSVNWQSGFDAWNIGGRANGNSNRGTGGLGDAPIFMFTGNTGENGTATLRRSPPTSTVDYESLDSLAHSMTGWDTLAGLD